MKTKDRGNLSATDKRPNIILIMADDLGYGSLGCYGSPSIKTPALDQLAADGLRLTDFHSNGSVCSPTRAALMTGRYPQRCRWVPDEDLSPDYRQQRKMNPAQRWAWGISKDEVTLPEVLATAGYRTALIGKWHLGYDVAFHPMNHGFHEFRGFMGGNVDYHTHVAGYGRKEPDWWKDREITAESGYTTDLLTRHAVDFISRNHAKPFFLYLAHAAPHDPWQGREPASRKSDPEHYQEMIGVLDESVASVGKALRDHGIERNTLLVFCSDNGAAGPRGFAANGRLRGRKGSVNEGGHRVPLIASWPGVIEAGKTSRETVITMDLFPTFMKLASAQLPANHPLDGVDIMPVLKGQSVKTSRTLHWSFRDDWAARDGAWKLMGKGETPLQLVNLDKDPGERLNLLDENPGLAKDLLQQHRKWIADVGNR